MALLGGWTTGFHYYLSIFDPQSQMASPELQEILQHYWAAIGNSYGVLEKPYISFDDFDGDGHEEIVCENMTHGGNMDNSAVYQYYAVNPDLSIGELFRYQTRLIYLPDEDWWVIREWQRVDETTLQLTTRLQRQDGTGESKLYGHIILKQTNPQGFYRCTGIEIAPECPDNEHWLLDAEWYP